MFPDNSSADLSKDVLVINLVQVPLKKIVEEKLLYFLTQSLPLGTDILKRFYNPIEQTLIEFCLEKYRGNQFKTSQMLGINRNTLKKKIVSYNLNVRKIKQFLRRSEKPPQSKIFLNSMSDLSLSSVCRAKLEWDNFQNNIPNSHILEKLCQPIEATIIYRVLSHVKGNQLRASHFLGIHRNTLKKKLDLMKLKTRDSL